MLKTLVKVGSISNLSDARYCAGMGVSLLGFDFNTDSPHYVTPHQAKEISGWLSGVEIVGEYHGMDIEGIRKILPDYQVAYLETDNPGAELAALGVPVIFRAFWEEKSGLDGLFDLEKYAFDNQSYFRYFLIESDAKKLSAEVWTIICKWGEHFPVILGFGTDANTINMILESGKISGIALRSSVEEKTGYTNADDLAELLEMMEED